MPSKVYVFVNARELSLVLKSKAGGVYLETPGFAQAAQAQECDWAQNTETLFATL